MLSKLVFLCSLLGVVLSSPVVTSTMIPSQNIPCSEPDPYAFDKCVVTCNSLEESWWNISLLEYDYDKMNGVSVFTYLVSVNKNGGKCSDIGDYEGVNKKPLFSQIALLYDGCCEKPNIDMLTAGMRPKNNFKYLQGGWSWEFHMKKSEFELVGVMLHGLVNTTMGSYCIRGSEFCYCDNILVPDLCNDDWEEYKGEDWVDSFSSSLSDSSSSKDEWDEKWNLKAYKKYTKDYQ